MAAFMVDAVHEYEINFICIKLLLFQMNVTERKMVVLWSSTLWPTKIAGEVFTWIVATA